MVMPTESCNSALESRSPASLSPRVAVFCSSKHCLPLPGGALQGYITPGGRVLHLQSFASARACPSFGSILPNMASVQVSGLALGEPRFLRGCMP